METKQNRTKVLVCVLALVALVLFSLSGYAGKLEPNSPPGPTMKTLQEIYDAASSGINEREGLCQTIQTPVSSSKDVLTVPAGKRFVLLKIHQHHCEFNCLPNWCFEVDGRLVINGYINFFGAEAGARTDRTTHDFPDRCVVVNAGETLTIVNGHATCPLNTTLIGYFYNVP